MPYPYYPYGGGYANSYYGNYNYQPQVPQPAQPIPQNGQPMQQTQPVAPAQPAPVVQPSQPLQHNKIYVTSLDDAMARFSSPNTVITYTLQDESTEFEITTDVSGKKYPRVFIRTEKTAQESAKHPAVDYVTREEFNGLRGKIQALEEAQKKFEVKPETKSEKGENKSK